MDLQSKNREIFTKDNLGNLDKDALIAMLLASQNQIKRLNENIDHLQEQFFLARQQRFGRSSEKLEVYGQLSFAFNEAEALTEDTEIAEPDLDAKPAKKKKQKGKRDQDLSHFPVKTIAHELSDEKLHEIFGDKWKRLPDEVYKRLRYHPATQEVEAHHVAVYASCDSQIVVKADRPKDLLRNSIATPSLVAAIMNAKYTNALPLNRMEQEFKRNGVNITRQVMSNWIIRCAELYLSLLYDRLHKELLLRHVIQADETPVEVTRDGRKAGADSYMWVYITGAFYTDKMVVVYEYQKTRATEHPRKFLKDFKGTVVSDGYIAYQKLDKEREDLTFAGCWVHARRDLANVVKTFAKDGAKISIANDALNQIAAIYKIEDSLKDLEPEARLKQRQLVIKPMVESLLAWAEKSLETLLPKSATAAGLRYILNHQETLKAFLHDGEVPMDNNAAERHIRPFCVGKHNWHLIDTINGAQASAIIYSIVETAKANRLNPYYYLDHLLTEIPKHMDDTGLDFLDDLLPWSDKLPATCHKPKT